MNTSNKKNLMANIRSLKEILEKYNINPATLIGSVLHAWCTDEYPKLTPSSLPVKSTLMNDLRMKAFLKMLIEQPFLEAAYWLSSTYALLEECDYRKSLAMYFTPPSLTERLLCDLERQGVSFCNSSFIDPACGGAAFLAPIALRMRKTLKAQGASPRKILKYVEKNLFGMDIDSTLCALSYQFLKMALYEEIRKTKQEPTFCIITGNSLCDLKTFFGTIDVLVCNPPYRKTSREEIRRYRNNFNDVIVAQPNMYALFIDLSIKLLKQNGVCALVTPTSFLSGQYFSKLRVFLMNEAQVLSIGMVSCRSGIFIDVMQETALTLLRRKSMTHSSQVSTSVSVLTRDGDYLDVGPCILPNSGAAWPIPRTETDVFLLKQAATLKFRIEDYGYTVRIGTFVWNRDTRPVFMSAADVKRRKARTAVPLIWSSDVKSGGILHFKGIEKTNGEPRFVSLGDKSHRSIIRRASVILQRVTSNDQSRRLIAAAIPQSIFDRYGGFVGENHTVILEQIIAKPALTPTQMAKLLGSDVIDRCFRCISGATNVSAFELSHLSLPDPLLLKRFLVMGMSVDAAALKAIYEHNNISSKALPNM